MDNLREQLAALAHEQWTGWMRYLFENSREDDDGRVEIPALLVARWKRQMNTSYVDLSENEKESDRVEADKMLRLIQLNGAPNPRSQSTDSTTEFSNGK